MTANPYSVEVLLQAVSAVLQYQCVTATGEPGNSSIAAHESIIVGVSLGNIAAGVQGKVLVTGLLFDDSWTWTAGSPVYLNATALSQTAPGAGFVLQVGIALTPKLLLVNFARSFSGAGAGGNYLLLLDAPPAPLPADVTKTWLVNYRDGSVSQYFDPDDLLWH